MASYVVRISHAGVRVEDLTFIEPCVLVGRDVTGIKLEDTNVSGSHGKLDFDGTQVWFTDTGSTNGTRGPDGHSLTAPLALTPNMTVGLGNSTITLISVAAAPPGTAVMAQGPMAAPAAPVAVPAPPAAIVAAAPPVVAGAACPPVAATPAPTAQDPKAGGAFATGGPSSVYSHPDQPVRHSYPLAITCGDISTAFSLLVKTAPFVMARLGVMVAMTVVAILYWCWMLGGFFVFGKGVGWIWFIAFASVGGWFWNTVVRYFLYLMKAAHIAVLTELITTGSINHGSEGMFVYGKRIVTERFGEVNILFALDMVIDGVIRQFNRTLNWVANLLPIPGVNNVKAIVNRIVHAATTYIDEPIFSYNVARGDENSWLSSKDALIYYAQKSKEVLKTGVWIAVLDYVLSAIITVFMFLPAWIIYLIIPASLGIWPVVTMVIFAFVFAADVRMAVLRPFFLTMMIVKFHDQVQSQPINLEWDSKLEQASDKFRDMKDKAANWISPKASDPAVGGGSGGAPGGVPSAFNL